jgi:hypothetical protein
VERERAIGCMFARQAARRLRSTRRMRQDATHLPRGATRAAFVTALVVACTVFVGSGSAAAQAAPTTGVPGVGNPCPSLVPASATGGGGANNMVIVHNPTGGDLQVRGSVQLNHVPGPTVGNVNCAAALSGAPAAFNPAVTRPMCVGCQTVAVALQIDLISRSASQITPRNVANAQNIRCQQCATVAIAMQYVIQVDDPNQVPPDAAALAAAMDDQLRQLQSNPALTPDEAVARIIAVRDQFVSLATSLTFDRSDAPPSP